MTATTGQTSVGAARGEAVAPTEQTTRPTHWGGVWRGISGWSQADAADIDDVAVERAMRGERVPGLTCWERREAVRRLRQGGASYRQIRHLLQITDTQICRDLRRFGLILRKSETLVEKRLSSVAACENRGPKVRTPATPASARGHGPTGLESSNV